MDDYEITLGVPEPLLDSLPEDGGDAARDMRRAVEGHQARIERIVAAADDESEVAAGVLDTIEHLEARAERYDEFVPELRAWGQSPIYAIAWRNLCADLIEQLYDHGDLAQRLDRERNQRLVDDGIRLSDVVDD